MDLLLASAAGQLRGHYDQRRAAFAAHAEWLGRLLADGVLILAGDDLLTLNLPEAWPTSLPPTSLASRIASTTRSAVGLPPL